MQRGIYPSTSGVESNKSNGCQTRRVVAYEDPRRSVPALLSQTFCPAFLSLCQSVPLPVCPGEMPFCPTFLSRLSVPQSFCPGKYHFVPPIKRGRERPRGKATEEVKLETDDEGNNPMPLQSKSPLQLQRNGLLHVVCSKYNLICIYYQLACLEKAGTVV